MQHIPSLNIQSVSTQFIEAGYAPDIRGHTKIFFKQFCCSNDFAQDGAGRSDTRIKLRKFFEVDRYYVTVAALKALADDGLIPVAKVSEAIKKYGIDPEKPNPVTV